ncbi:MAG: hypothetical protein HYV27_07275 [Candidatus Hydrogenedentes bacterium]|nr:hypothetical protein [Candidatus Hydrogenedentota bacterium]
MRNVLILAAIFLGIGFSGCPLPPPSAPFGTTGSYTGTWEGQDSGTGEDLVCELDLSLEQDTSLPFPQNFGVTGMALVDLSCTQLGAILEAYDQPVVQEVMVTGVLGGNGEMLLANGACPPGFCVVLAFGGQGEDNDGDGLMDSYSGEWNFTVLPPGMEAHIFTGTFSLEAE